MTEPVIYGANGDPLPQDLRRMARTRARINALGRFNPAYQGAGIDHPSLRDWSAPYVSGQGALAGEREILAARVHDLVRNDGWTSSAVTKKLNNIVGSGWRLNALPNWRVLGISRDEAEAVSDRIEALWLDYATETGFWADAERAGNVSSVLGLAARHYIIDGESFGVLVWRDESPTGFQTAMQVVHPQRCSNPNMVPDREDLRDGVALDALGAACGYWFRQAHPGDRFLAGRNPMTWEYFPRETEWGRPRVVHCYTRGEAGMTRAVSDFVANLRKQRQIHQYDDFELRAAGMNALLAAFIKTPFDAELLADAMDATDPAQKLSDTMQAMADAQASVYSQDPIRLDGAQLNFLNPGEDVILTRPQHPNSGFEAFVKFGLRNLAAVAGITAEQLTQDWSEVNYSSARAALQEVWKGFHTMKAVVASQFMQPWYRAWLEEVFDKGLVEVPAGAPPFRDAPEAWAQADWIGTGRGYIDPQKEAEAAAMRISLGVSTLEREAAEQGLDWKAVAEQRAREREFLRSLGMDPDAGRPEARIQPQEPDEEEPSAAEQKRRRARSRSGVPLIARRPG
ncbi:phage portal protein [Oricola thermophila]|uniref:Phage portal protein n=1 Tax=Oricola thermophila TaxID=2742145 RepID=A0A6N1VGE5_9HYPH|nr:phage portal protein [Oricola thermophila]QKV18725.1 phage portal protein [Oricola thermophila]